MMAGLVVVDPRTMLDAAALGIGRTVIKPADMGERQRGSTHGTGLKRDVDVVIDEALGAQLAEREVERNHLGVRRGVAQLLDSVGGGCDDIARRAVDDDGADRHFAALGGVARRIERDVHIS